MKPSQYVEDALKTESMDLPAIRSRINETQKIRLLHAAMGLETEVGEFMDPLKKYFFYGKEISLVNLGEEIGDILWYCAIACDALGLDLEQVMITNIEKLKTRFPDKFDKAHAIDRNLELENKTLNKGLTPYPI